MSKIENLVSMIGRSWRNKQTGHSYKFLSQTRVKDIVKVATDTEWFEIPYYDLKLWMDNFEEIPSENTPQENKQVTVYPSGKGHLPSSSLGGNETIIKLRDILLENIDSVKKDAKYIPQAKTISDTVNALVNLAKAELDLRTKG